MIVAWYAFTILAGVCIMFTVAHVIGGWLFERDGDSGQRDDYWDWVSTAYDERRGWDGILANPPIGDAEPDRVAEMEAVAAAAWEEWSR